MSMAGHCTLKMCFGVTPLPRGITSLDKLHPANRFRPRRDGLPGCQLNPIVIRKLRPGLALYEVLVLSRPFYSDATMPECLDSCNLNRAKRGQ